MSVSMRDPSRTLLFSGVAIAAVLAGAGFYLFFANVPERGAASQRIAAAPPQKIERADIERMIQERNAFAPRPGDREMLSAKMEQAARSREARAQEIVVGETLADTLRPDLAAEGAQFGAVVADAPPPAIAAAPPAPSAAMDAAPEQEDEAYRAMRQQAASAAPAEEGERMFRNGLYPEALAYWREKAEAGDRWAAYRLGIELLDGKPNVVARDTAEGAKFMLQSAEANEELAQFEMGTLYEYGIGVPADIATASQWYRKAAERGFPQAQYNFATMLENGDGVDPDRVEALKFYTLAAEQGFLSLPVDGEGRLDSNAPTSLDRLRGALSAAEVREAEKRAADFVAVED